MGSMRWHKTFCIASCILACTVLDGQGDEVRRADGAIIQGTAGKATRSGLTVDTPKGTKTYPWEQLSPGTRYRYDSIYRFNYETVLDGLPPSARTNEPIGNARAPKDEPTQKQQEQPSDEPAPSSENLRILDTLLYENINPISVQAFPGLELRSPSLALFWGLQYGAGANEIVYMAFDTPRIGEPHDTLVVYSPSHEDFTTPVTIRGTRSRVGEQRVVNFKEFTVDTSFDGVAASFDIECTDSGRNTDALAVTIEGTLESGDVTTTFTLYTEPDDLTTGEGIVRVRGILDLPIVWLGLDPESSSPTLAGSLRMSRMAMLPRKGMDTRVVITVRDESESLILQEKERITDKSLREKYAFRVDASKLEAGRYLVEATVDLGPFLGEIHFRRKITIPAGG